MGLLQLKLNALSPPIMYINTNLDDDRAEKLTRIQQQTNEDIAQIIHHALDLYYQQL